jgi:hypothetical protein
VAGAERRAGCGYGGAKPGPEPGGCHPDVLLEARTVAEWINIKEQAYISLLPFHIFMGNCEREKEESG